MRVYKFAQSTFLFESAAGKRMLLDPGKYNFDKGFRPEDWGRVDLLIVTHKHADHFDIEATKSIVSLCAPTVVTNPEVAVLLQQQSIGCVIANVGDRREVEGFTLTFIKTDHVVRDEAIVNFGLVIEADGKRVYHTSDTRLMELQVLPEAVSRPDVLCLPIGNRGVVMGIDDALYFANEIRPRVMIPMHYDSPNDSGRVRPEHFAERLAVLSASLSNLREVTVTTLQFGDAITVS